MPTTDRIMVGAKGKIIELQAVEADGVTARNLSAVAEADINIKLRLRDGTATTHAATFSDDGSDGKVRITTDGTEITASGQWLAAIEIDSSVIEDESLPRYIDAYDPL